MQSYNHPGIAHPVAPGIPVHPLTAWQYPHPPHHSASLDVSPSQFAARPRYASESGPSPHMSQTSSPSIVPPSLTPGGQHARVWDKSAAQQPRTTMPSPYHSPQRSSLYGDHFFSHPHPFHSPPPLPQKPLFKPLTNPLPPIPPKPPALAVPPASRIPLYPTSIPLPMASPFTPPPEPIAPETLSDEIEIEHALRLSAVEARKREEQLIAQEEELARALEESRLLSNVVYPFEKQSPSSASPISPFIDRASISALKAPAHTPEGESWLHIITPTTSSSSHHSSINEDYSPLPSPAPPDEPEDDLGDFTRSTQNVHASRDALPLTPPLYANVVSNFVRNPLPPSLSRSTGSSPSLASTTTYLPSEVPPFSDRGPGSPSLSLTHSSSSEHLHMPPFVPRPSWTSVSSENSTSGGRSLGSELVLASNGHKSPAHSPTSPNFSFTSSPNLDSLDKDSEEEANAEPGPSTRSAIPLTANQYVERDMLVGISLGFTIPVISTELLPMAGVMPNVITLPYGRAPLFHLQAPSWRRLLKLMARLSGTRVEPTVEALSVAKHDLKLRTVIQFIKIHHSASEWRTVLYLTTDHPVPCNVQNSHKYTNGDVNTLPYSYTLSPLPTLLRDSSESSMAKYYVVPSTPTTPYPTLPINFPNLAMYLQSAVQDSRRAASDSSSGLRKLAQYIDSCYHSEAERGLPIIDEAVPKKGVGGMLKRVMGRNRTNKNSRGNDEIFDLVTPFVSDEWG